MGIIICFALTMHIPTLTPGARTRSENVHLLASVWTRVWPDFGMTRVCLSPRHSHISHPCLLIYTGTVLSCGCRGAHVCIVVGLPGVTRGLAKFVSELACFWHLGSVGSRLQAFAMPHGRTDTIFDFIETETVRDRSRSPRAQVVEPDAKKVFAALPHLSFTLLTCHFPGTADKRQLLPNCGLCSFARMLQLP
jgi:hypothetical protein